MEGRWATPGACDPRAGGSRLDRPLGFRLAPVLAAALLGACAGSPEPAAPLCPQVGIINGLERLERTAPDGTGAVAYRAALENIDGVCRPEGNDLAVDITLDVVVHPGPALADRVIELPYFVAVSAPGGDVLERRDFVARVEVPPGTRVAGVTESFTQRFVGAATGVPDHQVLFGFALPAEQALRQRRGG